MSNLFGTLARRQVFQSPNGRQVMLDLYSLLAEGETPGFMVRLGISNFPTHYLRFGSPLEDERRACDLFDATAALLSCDEIKGWADLRAQRLIEIAKSRNLGLTEVK